jgi:hypothetical protein
MAGGKMKSGRTIRGAGRKIRPWVAATTTTGSASRGLAGSAARATQQVCPMHLQG